MNSDTQPPLASLPIRIWQRFRKQYFWLIADQVLVSGANFVLSVVIARLLGPEGFGKYSLIVVILLLLEIIQRAFIATPMMTIAHSYRGQAREYYFEGLSRMQNGAMMVLVPLT